MEPGGDWPLGRGIEDRDAARARIPLEPGLHAIDRPGDRVGGGGGEQDLGRRPAPLRGLRGNHRGFVIDIRQLVCLERSGGQEPVGELQDGSRIAVVGAEDARAPLGLDSGLLPAETAAEDVGALIGTAVAQALKLFQKGITPKNLAKGAEKVMKVAIKVAAKGR